MIRNGMKFSVFLGIYIAFSLFFHQGPLINWLDAIVDFSSLSGLLAFLFIESLSVLLWILILTPMFFISMKLGKLIAIILLILNATATFWMSSLGIVINQELIASLFFTDYSEASEFLNLEYLIHLFIFGLIPSAVVAFVPIKPITRIRLALYPIGSIAMLAVITSLNPTLTDWVDDNGAYLGSRLLPWSYIGKTIGYAQDMRKGYYSRYYGEFSQLPDGAAADEEPGLVVSVIGESSRAASYSYYGYERPINQATQKAGYIALPKSRSCYTSTMITTGCILSVNGRNDWKEEATEPLPSYLHRLGIKTFVRTNNTEMPRLNVGNYQTSTQLANVCVTEICSDYNVLKCDQAFCVERYFDNMLLANLGPILETAKTEKVFLLLHFRGSHGPNYSDRSPKDFTPYSPSCDAHVTQCDLEALINSYDNSTIFTDKTLAGLAQILYDEDELSSVVLYLSDHGQSLGENGSYMHGASPAEAPIEQLEIPFLIWMSDAFKKSRDTSGVATKPVPAQDATFHSILGALNVVGGPYLSERDIFYVE